MIMFRLSGVLVYGKLHFYLERWRLIKETTRYYDLRSDKVPSRRVYKELLNQPRLETKSYTNGTLCYSAFCTDETLKDVQQIILQKLKEEVRVYENALRLNEEGLSQPDLRLKFVAEGLAM